MKITIVGCGPGSRDYLTPVAVAAIEGAEVLIGASRLLALFPEAGKERIIMGKDTESVLREIAIRLGKRPMAVLVTGDPGLFSLASAVIKRFGRASCNIVPGISALQTAFARLGISWEDAKIISTHAVHGELNSEELSKYDKIAILGGSPELLRRLSPLMNALGQGGYRMFAGEDLTLPEERFFEITADGQQENKTLSTRAIILIIREDIL